MLKPPTYVVNLLMLLTFNLTARSLIVVFGTSEFLLTTGYPISSCRKVKIDSMSAFLVDTQYDAPADIIALCFLPFMLKTL
jgi:hypothetical protein